MDPATLAAAVTSLLAPYLAKAGGAILDRAAAGLPDAAQHLWDKITKHFEGQPAAAGAATEMAKNASDEDKQAAFALQLKMALKDDPEFAATVQELVKKAGAAPEGGGHNVTFTSGNISGSSVVFGNNNDVKSG
ncbi:MAG: hypothetical protein ACM3MF_09770 [Anaerolineae bacterium]